MMMMAIAFSGEGRLGTRPTQKYAHTKQNDEPERILSSIRITNKE
jgi:hypothetical protein